MSDLYQNERFVYFDIETIPCQDPAYLDKLRAEVTAPASYKKPESIEAWLSENRESAAQEALAKTSFDAGRGHVCTIAWAKNDGDVIHCTGSVGFEAKLIADFFACLDDYHSETLVGHYIHGFDIPFLTKRAIALGVNLPPKHVWPRDPKPWSNGLHDTMVMWSGAKDKISMDNLCDILGIPGKGDFDGSMVAEAWANGEHDKIANYCADDVERTRAIHQKFLKAGW